MNNLKRASLSFLILINILFLSSCNNDNAAGLKNIQLENNKLSTENSNLQSEKDKLNERIRTLESEVDELKNGADRRLNEIQEMYANKFYDEAVKSAKLLSERHPGSKESIAANKIVKQIESIKAEENRKKAALEIKQKQEAERSAKDKARSIIRVKSVHTSSPNSASGVDLNIVWQNKSNDIIKYADFAVEAYNAVGDAVKCDISRESIFSGRVTGPINPGQWYGNDTRWKCAWYNYSIKSAKLTQIVIEYMNGSTTTLTGQDLVYVKY